MAADSGIALKALKVDGGMTASEPLMRFQSDILGIEVQRPKVRETTALGAAYAAGLAVGFWKDRAEIASHWSAEATWSPSMPESERSQRYGLWKKAVEKSMGWLP
jgi:glycerol kinase